MNTIRGIPLHLLANSKFFPALETLALIWKRKKESLCSPVDEACFTHIVGVAIFIATCLWFLIGMIWPAHFGVSPTICLCVLATLLIVGLNLHCEGRKFARDLDRLDMALSSSRSDGIINLPCEVAGIQREINQGLEYLARLVKNMEDRNNEAWRIENARKRFVRLHEIAQEFGFDPGPYGKFFNPEAEPQTESDLK